MITGHECGPNFLTFVLRLRENPENDTTGDRTRTLCVRSNDIISRNTVGLRKFLYNLIYYLIHGCGRVAHCVTARWRNFSHYCRPLRHYNVWLRVLITETHWQPRRQHTVYRNKRLEFATLQVGKLRYVTAVDGGLKRFPWVAWFAHPWVIRYT